MSDDLKALDDFDGTARLFPLPNVVLFPQVLLPLHIFEPRYRQMTADALQADRLIALVLLKPGWEADYQGRPDIYPTACLGKIIAEQRLEDGRYNVLLRGLSRVRLLRELDQDVLYRSAHAELLRDFSSTDPEVARALREKLTRAATSWFVGMSLPSEEISKLVASELSLGALADILSFALPLPIELKQELLEEPDAELRVGRLALYLQTNLPPKKAASPDQAFPPQFSPN
jgi:Lon protease-like protein